MLEKADEITKCTRAISRMDMTVSLGLVASGRVSVYVWVGVHVLTLLYRAIVSQ